MYNLVRINLLPYRERRVHELRIHFFSVTAIVAVVAILVVLGINFFLNTFVISQQSRVDELQSYIQAQDREIAEIAKLKKEIEVLIGRKSVIESLQDEKNTPIYLFNALTSKIPPEGIYLETFQQQKESITLTAIADGNARISTFISNLGTGNSFTNVHLGSSNQFTYGNQNFFRFNLTFKSLINNKS